MADGVRPQWRGTACVEREQSASFCARARTFSHAHFLDAHMNMCAGQMPPRTLQTPSRDAPKHVLHDHRAVPYTMHTRPCGFVSDSWLSSSACTRPLLMNRTTISCFLLFCGCPSRSQMHEKKSSAYHVPCGRSPPKRTRRSIRTLLPALAARCLQLGPGGVGSVLRSRGCCLLVPALRLQPRSLVAPTSLSAVVAAAATATAALRRPFPWYRASRQNRHSHRTRWQPEPPLPRIAAA